MGSTTVRVVYASQTGTAQEYAARAVRRLYFSGHDVLFLDMSQVSLQALSSYRVVLLVISTCGQGELPINAKGLWKQLLNASLPSDTLANTCYSVLGLGDSSYEHYNYAAKKVYRRFEQLGAQLLAPIIYADEQSACGIDDGYEVWMQGIFEAVPCPQDNSTASHMYTLNTSNSSSDLVFDGTICRNELITEDGYSEKQVRLIRIASMAKEYRPGDVAVLYPQSQECDVLGLCRRLDWNPHPRYTYTPNRPDSVVSQFSCSLLELLKHYLDIYTFPKRFFFTVLAPFATSSEEKEKLIDIAGTDYDLYLDYVARPRRTPLEVLFDFPSITNVPIELVFDMFPLVRPRSFSIASYNHCGFIEIAAALVRYRSRWIAEEREGLASRFLSRASPDCPVRVSIVSGDISSGVAMMPSFKTVVLIGAGTGIAPLRSIIHYLGQTNGHEGRQVYLFYGCRYLDKDCLFAEELKKLEWVKYFCLGSRDRADEKHYIDRLLFMHTSELRQVLVRDSIVFLAGNNHLPKLVKACIDSITESPGFSALMVKAGRFHYECWS